MLLISQVKLRVVEFVPTMSKVLSIGWEEDMISFLTNNECGVVLYHKPKKYTTKSLVYAPIYCNDVSIFCAERMAVNETSITHALDSLFTRSSLMQFIFIGTQ